MKNVTVKDFFGWAAEIILGFVVAGFMFTQSMNFFYFAFPDNQHNIAWLGLGLTGGGMIAYFVMLKTGHANTSLKRFIVLGMIAVCTLGELATAGYGTQIESMRKAGLSMTEEGISTWINVIRILGLLHALAFIGFLGGDDISSAFADKNHNGIPDILEQKPSQYRVPQTPIRSNGADVEHVTDFTKPPR